MTEPNAQQLLTSSDRLKYLRTKILRLSGREFAEALNMSQGQISHAETGRNFLSKKPLRALQEKFNVSLDWLLDGVGEPLTAPIPGTQSKLHTGGLKPMASTAVPIVNFLKDISKDINNESELSAVPSVSIFGFSDSKARAFNVTGNSMTPTIYDKDIVIGAPALRTELVSHEQVSVLVLKDNTIIVARCKYNNQDGTMSFTYDNENYNNNADFQSIPASDIVISYTAVMNITRQIPSYDMNQNSMSELINKVNKLISTLDMKN